MTIGWLAWVAAHAAPMHWERIPAPTDADGTPMPVRDVVVTESAVVARDEHGGLHAWRSGWSRLAEPTAVSAADGTLAVATDGTVWVARSQPAMVQRFDGAWAPPEPVSWSYLTSIATDQDALWVAAMFGGLLHRAPDGTWTEVDGPDGHLTVVADPTGGAWAWSHAPDAVAVHLSDGRVDGPPFALDTNWRSDGVGADPSGTPWLVTPSGAAPLGEAPRPDIVAIDTRARWGHTGTHAVDLATGARLPLPVARVDHLAASPDGTPWLVHDGDLWRGVPGPGPILRTGSRAWGVGHLVDVMAAMAGDLDGDTRDDLVVRTTGGGVRVLRQGPDRFVDVTTDWFDTPPATAVPAAVCDVDGDGRDDLLARVPDDGAAPLHLWRAQPGWMEPATAASGLGRLPAWAASFNGDTTCADLDADGDLDLILTTGGHTTWDRSVLVAINRGSGHFAAADMPRRGLAVSRAWVRQVHPQDINADGILDYVLTNNWGRGHAVLLGTGEGRLRDVTLGAGLRGMYQEPRWSWVSDVTADGLPDLVTAGTLGVHGWQGRGDGTFISRDAEWGLVPLSGRVRAAILTDLDGQDGPELLARVGEAWHLQATGEGLWTDLSPSLPDLGDTTDAVAMDLGGDGDVDVLVWGDDDERWLENMSGGPPPAPTQGNPWARVAWARPLDWLALALAALVAAGTRIALRGGGLRVGPAGRPGAVAVAAIGLLAWFWALERRPPTRWAVHGLGWVPALAWGIAAIGANRIREAHRIGAYRLSRVIGRGATGTVYAAKDPRTGEDVAVKVIDPDLLTGERDRALFRREAELGAAIDDPRVVRILAYGEWTVADGLRLRPTAYLVLERVHGASLRDVLAAGRLDTAAACTIVREICLGLAAVHAAGVVHRDIKPENVAIARTGAVKVMDFGAARRVGSETVGMGRMLGTLAYLAPEQAMGRVPTPATDIYACGVVLYECLTGVRPFQDTDIPAVLTSRRAPPPRPGGIPDDLWALLAALLAHDPSDRPPTAAAAAERLTPWATGAVPVPTGPITPAPAPRQTGWRVHAPVLWRIVTLYLRHARHGGAPDRAAFAVGLLAVDDPPPSGRLPTERSDAS